MPAIALPRSTVRPRPRWDVLAAVLEGELVLPSSLRFDVVRKPALTRFAAVRPRAVARCATAADVGEALRFARLASVSVAMRSGGHCFAGGSSGRGLIVDLGPLARVDVRDGLAWVGAGTRLGALYRGLAEYGLTLPAGCGDSVGIAGLTLGGGLGDLGRLYGLTSDRLRAAEVVLADGRIVRCDDRNHPELFWALRGGGAEGVGVVTALCFKPVPDSPATGFRLSWPSERAQAVVDAWQGYAPVAPRELSATLSLQAPGDPAAAPTVVVAGAAIASTADTESQLDLLAGRVGSAPTEVTLEHRPYHDIKRRHAGSDRHDDLEISRSEFFDQLLPPAAIAVLVHRLRSARRPGECRTVDLLPLGGAYDDVPGHATAFAHRHQRFVVKHTAAVPIDATAGARGAAARWLDGSFATTRPWGTGRVYANFADPALRNPQRAYYAENLPRLRRVTHAYDPDRLLAAHTSAPRHRARSKDT